jgi:hypothetical protein
MGAVRIALRDLAQQPHDQGLVQEGMEVKEEEETRSVKAADVGQGAGWLFVDALGRVLATIEPAQTLARRPAEEHQAAAGGDALKELDDARLLARLHEDDGDAGGD